MFSRNDYTCANYCGSVILIHIRRARSTQKQSACFYRRSCSDIMERIFLFGVLLLPSFISLSCAQATGNSNDDLDYILTGMCTQSSGTIFQRMVYNQRIFSSWIQELRSVPKAEKVTRYFHPKPVDSEFVKWSICSMVLNSIHNTVVPSCYIDVWLFLFYIQLPRVHSVNQ